MRPVKFRKPVPEATESLVLDLRGLEYISSSGVRQLVAAHKRMNGSMKLRDVPPEILSILKTTGINKRLHIE